VFFLSAEGKVYARYGGRDAKDPDSRQSLDGLRYTMQSVLEAHGRAEKEFAPRSEEGAKYVRDVAGGRRRGCYHCHNVKEALNADLEKKGEWTRDLVWRYPLPESVGVELEVGRGNVVRAVRAKSPAAAAGLKAGDVLRRLNGVPLHSQADVQFALDKAPKVGAAEVVWARGEKTMRAKLALPEGWHKGDVTWRPSMQYVVPSARLYGDDLKPEEKKALGIPANQLAFRQKGSVPSQAKAAGVRPGDVIVGVDGKTLEMDVGDFIHYVARSYLVGDRVTVNVLRDGKRLDLVMLLKP
jgi:S1-C subfamily serine protease